MQNVINAFKQIEALAEQEQDIISPIAYSYCLENGILRSSKIEEAYLALNSGENKMLNIGIVGRVKAGKSSLLNAIFFKGEDILPKAATPMTASLTLLSYGNNEASVELFSKNDIADIKKVHDAYLSIKDKKLVTAKEDAIKILEKKQKREFSLPSLKRVCTLSPEQESQLEQKVDRSMLSHPTRSYFELYEGIQSNQLLAQIVQGDQSIVQTLNANSPQEIASELNKYVGSSGANSSITKSAQLKLDIPELKDLRIVDTPGLNDPVASRSQRTIDFMSQCDVIFVVIPCSQFMSSDDVRLMINAIQEQSINKIYVIASQADTTMISDVADKNGHIFAPSFESLSHDLQLSLSDCMQGNERKALHEALSGAQVLLTSSICFSIERKLKEGAVLSENEELVLDNLKSTYPEAFSSKEQTLLALHQLAGVEAVQAAVSEVRAQKDAIIKERQAAFARDQRASVERYIDHLQQKLRERQLEFETTDLSELQGSTEEITKVRSELSSDINIAFGRSFSELKSDLRDYFATLARSFVNRSGTNAEQHLDVTVTVEHYTTSKWLIFKEHHTTTETTKSIDASQVRLEVQGFFSELTNSVNRTLDHVLYDWIDKAVVEEVNVANTQDLSWCLSHGLRARDIEQAVKTSIYELKNQLPQIDLTEFNFGTKFTDSVQEQQSCNRFSFLFSSSVSSKSGMLYNSEATDFLSKLRELLSWFEQTFNQKCNRYLDDLEQLSNKIDISKSIFNKLDKQLESLQKQLSDKEGTLELYKMCSDRLSQIASELNSSEAN